MAELNSHIEELLELTEEQGKNLEKLQVFRRSIICQFDLAEYVQEQNKRKIDGFEDRFGKLAWAVAELASSVQSMEMTMATIKTEMATV